MDRLKTSFGITEDVFDSYAELEKLWVKNRGNVVNYIDRAQIVYNNIIEAEKSEREPLTNLDVARINDRFVHTFYCGLSSDIRTLVEKRNDLSSTEIYEIIEKANQEFVSQDEIQMAYTSLCRFLRSGASRNCPRGRMEKLTKRSQPARFARTI